MQDHEICEFETGLWTGSAENYRDKMDGENVVMTVPGEPFMLKGKEAIDTVADTPRWKSVELEDLTISRPQHGLITLAYHARARRDGADDDYEAYCTSTYRRLDDEQWKVIQHSQTVVPSA